MRQYQLVPIGDDAPLTVEVAVPADWTVDASDPEGPSFVIPDAEIRVLGITALMLKGDPDTRMARAIRMQYGDADGAERSALSGGRVWMVRREKAVDHARLFVPYRDGVVMAVAVLTHASAGRLPAIQQVFETLAVAAR